MALTDAERARRYRQRKKRDASRDENASRHVTKQRHENVTKRHVTRHEEGEENQPVNGKKRHETSRDASPVYIYSNTESEETPSRESLSSEEPTFQTPSHGSSAQNVTDFKKALWQISVGWLRETSGRPDGQCRSMLGKWIKAHGVGETVAALLAANDESPVDPISWIVARLQASPPPAAPQARRYEQRRSYGQTNPDERHTARVDHFPDWSERMRLVMAELLKMGKPSRLTFQDMAALVKHGYASAEDAKTCGCPEDLLCFDKS